MVYHCVVVGATNCRVAPAGCVYPALAERLLIMPLVAGYTSRLFALVLVMVIAIPATAVGSTTPAPEATVDTTLISFDIAVAVPWVDPAADMLVPTERK